MARDWHAWHRAYDDPGSSLSRRLAEVRLQVAHLLTGDPTAGDQTGDRPRQIVSLCAGDGRDLLPELAAHAPTTRTLLVELDPDLAGAAASYAAESGLSAVEVRTADAGLVDSLAGHVPADLLLVCGVFGNVDEAGVSRTISALPSLLTPGGHVVWTRGVGAPADTVAVEAAVAAAVEAVEAAGGSAGGSADGTGTGDAADRVRAMFDAAGFDEVAFVRPADAAFRVGVHRLEQPPTTYTPGVRLFDFLP